MEFCVLVGPIQLGLQRSDLRLKCFAALERLPSPQLRLGLPESRFLAVTSLACDTSQVRTRRDVDALHPRVAIMNNGAHKGGKPEAWKTVHDSPGLQDFWQVHYAEDAGKDYNVPENFIANLDQTEGAYIKVSAQPDGTFTVTNSRNQYSKTYKKSDESAAQSASAK